VLPEIRNAWKTRILDRWQTGPPPTSVSYPITH
jgi:hypothetical protein